MGAQGAHRAPPTTRRPAVNSTAAPLRRCKQSQRRAPTCFPPPGERGEKAARRCRGAMRRPGTPKESQRSGMGNVRGVRVALLQIEGAYIVPVTSFPGIQPPNHTARFRPCPSAHCHPLRLTGPPRVEGWPRHAIQWRTRTSDVHDGDHAPPGCLARRPVLPGARRAARASAPSRGTGRGG